MISAHNLKSNGIEGFAKNIRSHSNGPLDPKEVWDPLKAFEKTSRKWVSSNPYIALGIAATIGVTLGCLIKRR
ncbi:hypothetical protein Pan54_21330 [Rubinisphaera italica]|uniref:Uncharacterized protein n=1 Tax=Rubinisphaera italica TaxID=2527969 RepID=A0A5C5XEC3_9PLAN|nr:hypothetical protein Pan54_21330 [Rubinisphaera italica]